MAAPASGQREPATPPAEARRADQALDREEVGAVTIALAPCGTDDDPRARARLVRQIETELRVAGFAVVGPLSAPDEVTQVTIVPAACHPGEGAAIVVRAPGRATLRRALELARDDAGRVLALALVEALRQAWEQDREEAAGAPSAEPREAIRDVRREHEALRGAVERRFEALRVARAETDAARRRRTRARHALPAWELYGGGTVLGYLGGGAALFGATIGGRLTLSGPLRIAAEGMGGYGIVDDALGEVGLGAFRGVVALELHVRAAPLSGFAGLWASAGWSRAEGRPEDAAAVGSAAFEDATGAAGLRAGGAFELSPGWSAFVQLDGGYAWGGVAANAEGRRIAATHGAVLSLSIGCRLVP